jgi:tight adherence protein C
MADFTPIIIAALAFCAVTAIVFVAGQYYNTYTQMLRRLPVSVKVSGSLGSSGGSSPTALQTFIARNFHEQRFGVDSTLRAKLRRDLLRAGYFRNDAINYYIFFRIVLVVILPLIAYLFVEYIFIIQSWLPKFAVLVISAGMGILGPDAWLSRRQGKLAEKFRTLFPDLLDLLVVCIDAGLSLEAAFDRVTGEIIKQNRAFGLNLAIMGEEMRAGRSTVDALESLADRLGLDEARSFMMLLRQSLELGSNVGDSLRVFSDEMRGKRLLRAEEMANKLSVKMVIPLSLFIFPVVLMVIGFPIGVRLAVLFSH